MKYSWSLKMNCTHCALTCFDRWLETAYISTSDGKTWRRAAHAEVFCIWNCSRFLHISCQQRQGNKVRGLRQEGGPAQRAAARLISPLRRPIRIQMWQTWSHYWSEDKTPATIHFVCEVAFVDPCSRVKLQLRQPYPDLSPSIRSVEHGAHQSWLQQICE